jgi:hypothetical protein
MIKVVKESAIVDHLINNDINEYRPLNFDFPDENVIIVEKEVENEWWMMYFNCAINVFRNGVGTVIIY